MDPFYIKQVDKLNMLQQINMVEIARASEGSTQPGLGKEIVLADAQMLKDL